MFKTINGEDYVSIDGIIIMTLHAILDPDVGREGKQRSTAMLNEFLRVAKAKGHDDAQKILCRGVIDEFSLSKAKEIAGDINTDEFVSILNNAGFNVAGITKM